MKVLGTPIKAIQETEDRELFVKKLNEINVMTPKSKAVYSTEQALKEAKKIGFPLMIRVGFALGGKGSGKVSDEIQLKKMCSEIFSHSKQALIEEYLGGWKEIEYEVVRDAFDNCITVCNMENFDPLGIHTGESIVVAPSQTLNNYEYHLLRELSIKVIRHLGIIGECNIQFAFNPLKSDYRVIEVNARLSRSSALASKATGYPLAFIAAKLALGFPLIEIPNPITKTTNAFFEPALDYCVVKIPRWDLNKFKNVSKKIGSGMKSVGEVMAIGRKFEEALQKALRMLGIGVKGLVCNEISLHELSRELTEPTDMRIFAIAKALQKNYSIEEIYEKTKIDKWFLFKLKNIIELEKELKKFNLNSISREMFLHAKQNGFSDKQLAKIFNSNELKVRKKRKSMKIVPAINQIDTYAAEFPAQTNYLYLTYNGIENDVKPFKNSVIVLGSGAYRIGSSVEFDWCCVKTVHYLKKLGYKTIMINFNPETVSTDYDECDKLFFDELGFETVMDIYEMEKPLGVVVSMGGQIPNNLALKLAKNNVKILGTSAKNIDWAEDRHKFSKLLDSIKVDQPEWREIKNLKDAENFAEKAGYPVLIRPSYVLSGSAMKVAFSKQSLKKYLKKATEISKKYPVVISKFYLNAKEIEVDGVARNGELLIYAISEHIENAGVHSGDATMVFPAQRIYSETNARIKSVARKIAKKLKITGPFNIQFLAKDNQIKVIECNVRASRSFPFVSKVIGKNFIEFAVKAMTGKKVSKSGFKGKLDYLGVKSPMFSFNRLPGADPVTGVEMASTGEAACLGKDIGEAFLKSVISANLQLPEKNVLLSIGGEENKYKLLNSVRRLKQMGFNLFATQNTHLFLKNNGIESIMLFKIKDKKEPNILTYLENRKVDFAINVSTQYKEDNLKDAYIIRRKTIDFNIPLITNTQLAQVFTKAIYEKKLNDLEIKSWNEYIKN